MRISVIVPTIGRASLARTLESLQNQTCSADEIIVEQDFDQAGPAITRNNGARRAHGDVLLFVDDDCVAAPNWIERMRAAFENPAVIAASGAVLYRGNVEDVRERAVQNPDALWFMGANCGVRRNTFWKLGGFPEKYLVYEDKALALACWERGYLVARVPLAHVYHEPSFWNPSMAKKFSNNLAWWVDLACDYDIWADKNNPPPIWGGIVLMPRDFGSFFKHLFNFTDEFHRLRAKLLFNQRINLWKRAIKNKKLLI
jgi:glycosyltransferase involved in cell wall biosynthesis